MQLLKSQLDASVNFVEQQLTGFVEARYVRRNPNYFIAYLSSQTGCNRGCQMCHLTATRQTQFTNLDQQEFVTQLETVLGHYERDVPAKLMHVNWMARGEPLANPTITETGTELLWRLGGMARDRNLQVKFNISTIMPKTLRKPLTEVFPIITPTIYYSIYSVDEAFRAQWLPAAMPVDMALNSLKEYQQISKKLVKFHCAFIKDQNDSAEHVNAMLKKIQSTDIRGEFNIVRYNPYSVEQGVESQRLEQIQAEIAQVMPVKTIPRVGFDAKASCGMFVHDTNWQLSIKLTNSWINMIKYVSSDNTIVVTANEVQGGQALHFSAGDELKDTLSWVQQYRSQLQREADMRMRNPDLQHLYDQYQTLLKLLASTQ